MTLPSVSLEPNDLLARFSTSADVKKFWVEHLADDWG